TVAREGYSPERIEVIYNGYDPGNYSLPEETGTVVPQGDMLKLVLVANIRAVKRIQDAIRALARLSESYPDTVLCIIGDGDQTTLTDLSLKLGIHENVRFLGPRSDVRALLPAFDVGLLCSESEGFSNTLIEYLSAGLAVSCTEVGGNPEIIEHGVTGLLYPAGDITALADNLIKLAREPATRAAMGKAGRERVQKEYSLPLMIARHEAVYATLSGSN
ncbi:MAG TPA: glycosyltransferase, partial [Gammaproteobacteria bacterium]|nr:glycosyltransferase [Gammaproteobacteria bacterium]